MAARTILLCGAVLWLLAGIVGIGVASLGREWLLQILPPLAIGADALGGAVSAFSMLCRPISPMLTSPDPSGVCRMNRLPCALTAQSRAR